MERWSKKIHVIPTVFYHSKFKIYKHFGSSCPQSHCPYFLKVKEVVLKSGKVLPADVLIVGIGKCIGEHLQTSIQ